MSVSVSGLSMPTKTTKQLGVVCQIDRGLRREFERIASFLLPLLQRRKKPFERLLVADEIIVNEVDVAAVAETKQRVELGQHLLIGLSAGNAPVQLDDVAELAIERAAARELNADISVVVRLEKLKERNRSLRHVGRELL